MGASGGARVQNLHAQFTQSFQAVIALPDAELALEKVTTATDRIARCRTLACHAERARIRSLSPAGVLALGLAAVSVHGCGGPDHQRRNAPTRVVPNGTAGTTGTPVDPDEAKTKPVDPGHVAVHRLNTTEYNATVADVLGTKLQPATANWRGGELGGFDNMAVGARRRRRPVPAATSTRPKRSPRTCSRNDALRAKFVTCATHGRPGLHQEHPRARPARESSVAR